MNFKCSGVRRSVLSSRLCFALASLGPAPGTAFCSSSGAAICRPSVADAITCTPHAEHLHLRRTSPARAVLTSPQPSSQPADGPPNTSASPSLGILLLNLGGPDSLENVEPFLYNLFSDPEIITLPSFLGWMNSPLAWIIASSRAPQSREGYQIVLDKCGSVSPQLSTTEAQGDRIVEALSRRGFRAKSYVAMRYWYPFTEDALSAIRADSIERLVVLPLYPQFSISTSGSSLRILEREFYADQSLRQGVRNVVIPAWYNREGYVNALARLISSKCDLNIDPSSPHIFFSAHGLPKKYIETLADPYKQQTEATVAFVMNRLRHLGYGNGHTLAYQSKVGPVEWLKPYTDDKIRELAAQGVENLVVVPISFVSEHIETLEEIDGEYRELAEEVGIHWWQRVPALGTEDDFIEDLAEAVIEVLPGLEEKATSDINEGRPVSLRVVNDLVQLRGKEEDVEYGQSRWQTGRLRFGLTSNAELINGRIAMAAVTAASIYSASKGTLLADIVEGQLPNEEEFLAGVIPAVFAAAERALTALSGGFL